MNINPVQEKITFQWLLKHVDHISLVNNRFFENEDINKIFRLVKSFTIKYNHPPSLDQLQQIVNENEEDIEVKRSIIEDIYKFDLSSYDETWVNENAKTHIEAKNLENSVLDVVSYMKTTKITPETIQDVVSTAKQIMNDGNQLLLDFEEPDDFFAVESHLQVNVPKYSTGYPFIDWSSGGGLSKKTLTVIAAGMKAGKSFFLCNLAANTMQLGYNSIYITLELGKEKVIKRIGSNVFNIPINEYEDYMKSKRNISSAITNYKENFGGGFTEIPGRLYVKEFPTSSASSIDIETYVNQFEKKKNIKFDFVYVDYINIMKNHRSPNSESTYMKMKNICEDLRAAAQRNNWIIVSVTQLKREALQSSMLNMADISESIAVAATVDNLYGMVNELALDLNDEISLQSLAIRDGEGMGYYKKYKRNKKYGRFVETKEEWKQIDNI